MKTLLNIVRDLAKVFVGPRVCDLCGLRTDRVTNSQYDAWLDSNGRILPCRCGGQLRTLLQVAAQSVDPDVQAGLARIQARTGAPGCTPETPAKADQLKGSRP